LPYSREHYLKVLEEARVDLEGVDFRKRAGVCGFDYRESDGGAQLNFVSLGVDYTIDLEKLDIMSEDGRVMPLQMRIVVLHFLKRENPVALTGELMPLTRFPELVNYAPVIRRRSEEILERRFADRPDLLPPAVEKLGGQVLDMADASGRLLPLPQLPVTFTVYESEPGLPGEATVMFDESAPKMLHLEDLVVIAELLSHKLVNVALKFVED